jgi:hypothetical protein
MSGCDPRRGGRAAVRPTPPRASEWLWLAAALAFALFFAGRTMAPAFRPDAVADDLIADYFEWVSPPGYRALYWALTRVADPLSASKLLPQYE